MLRAIYINLFHFHIPKQNYLFLKPSCLHADSLYILFLLSSLSAEQAFDIKSVVISWSTQI